MSCLSVFTYRSINSLFFHFSVSPPFIISLPHYFTFTISPSRPDSIVVARVRTQVWPHMRNLKPVPRDICILRKEEQKGRWKVGRRGMERYIKERTSSISTLSINYIDNHWNIQIRQYYLTLWTEPINFISSAGVWIFRNIVANINMEGSSFCRPMCISLNDSHTLSFPVCPCVCLSICASRHLCFVLPLSPSPIPLLSLALFYPLPPSLSPNTSGSTCLCLTLLPVWWQNSTCRHSWPYRLPASHSSFSLPGTHLPSPVCNLSTHAL